MAKEPHPDSGVVIALIDCPHCGNPHVKVKLNKNGRQYWKCAPNASLRNCFAEYNYPPASKALYEDFLANDRKPVDKRQPKEQVETVHNVGGKKYGFC
jgi:hypothetical protein